MKVQQVWINKKQYFPKICLKLKVDLFQVFYLSNTTNTKAVLLFKWRKRKENTEHFIVCPPA